MLVGRGQRPHDELREVVEDAAALFHGGFDRGEVVVGEDHVGGLLGHLGSAPPHRDANVGLPQGWGVVDPVSGHRDYMPTALQRLDHAMFLLRGDPGEHSRPVYRLVVRAGWQALQVNANQYPPIEPAAGVLDLAVAGACGRAAIAVSALR
jgi:hypothetical protein